MEDFHVSHLSDEQMKTLNPLIRKCIYSALYSLAHLDKDKNAKRYLDWQLKCIPDYWEDSESPFTTNQENRVFDPKFSSIFLQDQIAIGNLFLNQIFEAVHITGSYELKGDGDKKKLKKKISQYLRKEGYGYYASIDGYVKLSFYRA